MKKEESYVFLDFYRINLYLRDLIDFMAYPENINMEKLEEIKRFFNLAIGPDRPISVFLDRNEVENGSAFYQSVLHFSQDTFKDFRYFELSDQKIKPILPKKNEFFEKILIMHQSFEYVLSGILKDYRNRHEPQQQLEALITADDNFYRLHFMNVIYQELLSVSSDFNKKMRENDSMTPENQNILDSLRELMSYFHDLKNKYSGNKGEIKQLFEDAFDVLKIMDGSKIVSYEELTDYIAKNNKRFSEYEYYFLEDWKKLYQRVLADMA